MQSSDSLCLSDHCYVRTSSSPSSSPSSSSSSVSSSSSPGVAANLLEISHVQLNFYGVKLDAPDSTIKVSE